MRARTKKPYNGLKAGIALAILGITLPGIARAQDADLDKKVISALQECRNVSTSCADTMKSAVGVLVFPHVVKADLIIGGSGGKGALIENNHITGYYEIGSGSVGLQAGVDTASQVYVFRTPDALAKLKNGPDWKAGADAGVTLIKTDKNVSSITGKTLVYVFDSEGLHGGVSLDVFDIWKSGQPRPQS